ncbi:tol-pal system protein YbgF [Neptunomonas japonica]|uniref:tol-pal system protein YbgF n=1 Tax=Neptunomonas japonica TaxID=417574 RepID=UPI000420C789|nr:tol-pal system protein YbgF [Neptunomonas japonica]
MKLIFPKRISVGLLATVLTVATQAAQVVPVIEINQGSGSSSNYALSQNSQLIITIQQLQDEVRELRGKLESQEYRFKRLETSQKERYRDLDRRLSLVLQSQMQDEDASGMATGGVQEDGSSEKMPPAPIKATGDVGKPAVKDQSKQLEQTSNLNDQGDYQAAFKLVRERNFNGAAESFSRFLTDYLDSPRVPNAHYWLGEIYLAQGKHLLSEEAFLRVADQYSQSRKAPDALYKLGILYKQQGDLKKSMTFMSRVVTEYPDTSAAQLAESALNQ